MKSARAWTCAGLVSLAAGYAGQAQSAPALPAANEAAATSAQQFRSDETWSIGSGATHAMPVCLNASNPANCPTVGPFLNYNYGGAGWGADLQTLNGAKWIWDATQIANDSGAENDELRTFKFFDLPDCVRSGGFSGKISIAADDFARVFVNGSLVVEVGSPSDVSLAFAAQSSLTPVDLSPFLAAGTNVIEVQAINGPGQFAGCQECSYSENPAGVVFGGELGCRR